MIGIGSTNNDFMQGTKKDKLEDNDGDTEDEKHNFELSVEITYWGKW